MRFRSALGAILQQAREAQHLGRPELAKMVGAGLSKESIYRYESGRRGIPVDVLPAWCEALGLDALTIVAEALDVSESA